jgi:hypothetical protein
MAKAFPYLLNTSGVVALIDSDAIATGSLQPNLKAAEEGKICAFADPEVDRYFPEWQELFHLSAPPRRQSYVTASYVVFSTKHWPRLLERWWQANSCVPSERTLRFGAPNSDPLAQGDQDALNAILMSEVAAESLLVLPHTERAAGKLPEVRVVNARKLQCKYQGSRTTILHVDGGRKPWEQRSILQIRNDAYVRLMSRLLFSDDVPLTIAPRELPIWLRPGLLPELTLRFLSAFNAATYPIVGRHAVRAYAKRYLGTFLCLLRRRQNQL